MVTVRGCSGPLLRPDVALDYGASVRAIWLTSFFLLGCHASTTATHRSLPPKTVEQVASAPVDESKGSFPKETIPRPPLDQSTAVKGGSLLKETIQQVIRTHLGEVRACFEQRLAIGAWESRIVTQFEIAPSGSVKRAVVIETTVPPDQSVEQCITNHMLTWRFPAPNGGGSVIVSYPFVLRMGTPPNS